MNKHTPGPWSYDAFISRVEVLDADGAIVVVFRNPTDQQINDARLIAAAPELLELVKHVVAELEERVPIGEQWREKAHAAIAKVWGAR
jgi:hypothetical protein